MKKSTQTTASCAFLFHSMNRLLSIPHFLAIPILLSPCSGLSYIQFYLMTLIRGNKTLLPGFFFLVHVLFVTWCPPQQPRRSAASQSWRFTAKPSISTY